jgi:hypothetical protein
MKEISEEQNNGYRSCPDLAVQLNAVPDPTFHFNADPDPDSDPTAHQSDANLRPLVWTPCRAPF